MPEPPHVLRRTVKLLGCGFALAASFFLFDRLLFWAVREGSARYYSSVQNDPLPWKTPYGQGDGQALILGTSRSQYGFTNFVLSKTLGMRVYKETKPGNFPQYNYYFYDRPDKFDLENPDYFGDLAWGILNCPMLDKGARLFSQELAAAVKSTLQAKSPEGIK